MNYFPRVMQIFLIIWKCIYIFLCDNHNVFLREHLSPNHVHSFENCREILSFYVPLVYAFKFLMDRETTKIRTTLKFWSMISCYRLIAFLLQHILDE